MQDHDVMNEIMNAVEGYVESEGNILDFDPVASEPMRGYAEMTVTAPDGTVQTFSVRIHELLPVPNRK